VEGLAQLVELVAVDPCEVGMQRRQRRSRVDDIRLQARPAGFQFGELGL